MSGLINKVKNALQSEKNTPEARAANQGNNEYGHAEHATGHGPGLHTGLEGDRKGSQLPGIERGEHIPAEPHNSSADTGVPGSVAHGSSVSPTNPGVLHSTKPGIHGERDSGTSGYSGLGSDNTTDLATGAGAAGAGAGAAGVAEHEKHKHGLGHEKTTTTSTEPEKHKQGLFHHGHKDTPTSAATQNTTTGDSAGPQYTGDNTRDTGLVGSGTTASGATTSQTGSGLAGTTGSDYNDNNSSGLAAGALAGGGAGAGAAGLASHEKNKHGHQDTTSTTAPNASGLTSSGTNTSSTGPDTGLAGAGSGYSGNNRDRGIVDSGSVAGSGLSGTTGTGGYGSTTDNTTAGSGLTSSNPSGSGLAGSGLTSNPGAEGAGLGATGGSSSGLSATIAEKYVQGSERHHPGDGHPEDIVHPGPHLSGTAKALDPHLH